jgi:hypothetical protein
VNPARATLCIVLLLALTGPAAAADVDAPKGKPAARQKAKEAPRQAPSADGEKRKDPAKPGRKTALPVDT